MATFLSEVEFPSQKRYYFSHTKMSHPQNVMWSKSLCMGGVWTTQGGGGQSTYTLKNFDLLTFFVWV